MALAGDGFNPANMNSSACTAWVSRCTSRLSEVGGQGQAGLAPCRIYAPVGPRDLLAYLVRRLLENGANSSFVNRIA
jgi:hypothetical protein